MKKNLSKEYLKKHWTITFDEDKFISNKNKAAKIVVIAKMKYLKLENRFPDSANDVPTSALYHIASQLGLTINDSDKYPWNSRTSRKHNTQIRNFLGYKEFSGTEKKSFEFWLVDTKVSQGLNKLKIIEDSLLYFRENKILTPRKQRLERDISSVLKSFEDAFFSKINKSLSKTTKKKIDQLLTITCPNNQQSLLSYLKNDTGQVSVGTLLASLDKLEIIKKYKIRSKIFKDCVWDLLKKYTEKVVVERLQDIDRRKDTRRYAFLACFLYTRKLEITDALIDITIRITNNLYVRAEKKADKALLKQAKQLGYSERMSLLTGISKVSVDEPKSTIEDAIYPVAGLDTLEQIADEDKPVEYRESQYKFIHSSYSHHYRRMIMPLITTLAFTSNAPEKNDVLKALAIVKTNFDHKKKAFNLEDVVLDGIVPKNCRKFICNGTKVHKKYYEICVLASLREGLRNKAIWIRDAYRYRDPQEDIHQDFYERPDFYFQAIKQPRDSNKFIKQAKKSLDKWMGIFNAGFSKNSKVLIETKKDKSRIKLLKSKPQVSPKNIEKLKAEIQDNWSETTLLDIVKEADFKINFTSELPSIGDRVFSNEEEYRKRKLLCVYGTGSNIGLKRASSADPEIHYEQLRHTHSLCMTIDNVRNACTKVTNKTLAIRDEITWGSSTALGTASDASQFPVWEQNDMVEWHIRNGGKGVMAYWHIDKKSLCVYSQLKKCSSSEAVSMIKGILYHSTEAEIESNCVDTRGQNLVAFGFSYILDFDLLCRFKSISNQKLYVSEKKHAYRSIGPIISRAINWELIEKYYEQIILYSVALKLKKADPESILKIFNSNNLKHPVLRALQELGRVVKTIFLCRYLHSEALRINIRETLNVVERWNGVNDFIFYGKKGVISTNNTKHQELSILCLHLIQACLVYINILMIQKILSLKRWQNVLTEIDKRALSPLMYEHINPYGRFTLNMAERINFKVSDE